MILINKELQATKAMTTADKVTEIFYLTNDFYSFLERRRQKSRSHFSKIE